MAVGRAISLVFAALACGSSETRARPASTAARPVATRQEPGDGRAELTIGARAWIANLQLTLPPMLCATDYFSTCFSSSGDECERIAVQELERCIEQHHDVIPSVPDPIRGHTAGDTLGRCTGRQLDKALVTAGREVRSAKCVALRAPTGTE